MPNVVNISGDVLEILVKQQPIIFEHMKIQMLWVFWGFIFFALLCLVWIRYAVRNKILTREGARTFRSWVGWVLLCLITVWVFIRIEVYFGEREFERTPETYIIKSLR